MAVELDVGHPIRLVPNRDEIRIEVRDEPGPVSGRLTCVYRLDDGRILEIQA
jgi:hypothetical protein